MSRILLADDDVELCEMLDVYTLCLSSKSLIQRFS